MLKVLVVCAITIAFNLLPAVAAQSLFYNIPGRMFYSLNSTNQTFDTDAAGNIAVALTNEFDQLHPALLTSFEPTTGNQLDSEIAGFGPLHVQVASLAPGTRVAALTSEGGPAAVSVYDLSLAGQFSLLGKSMLTSSIVDYRSNMVLSSSARVGFVLVSRPNNQPGNDLVVFSLDNSAVLARLTVGFSLSSLAMYESAGNRTLVFLRNIPMTALVKVDATDPIHPIESGSVLLPQNSNVGGSLNAGIAFTSDGRFAFVANPVNRFSVTDLNTMTVVASLQGSFREKIAIFENPSRRLLAIERLSEIFSSATLLLIDASNPGNPLVVNSLDLTGLDGRETFEFSRFGTRLVLAKATGFNVIEVPTLSTLAFFPISDAQEDRVQGLHILGSGKALGEWGIFTSLFGIIDINEAPLFDICLQDDSNGSVLQVNLTTGAYSLTNCRGVTVNGTGSIVRKGCYLTLQVNGPDRRGLVRIDSCANTATASIQLFSAGTTITIVDRNTANNTCSCANAFN